MNRQCALLLLLSLVLAGIGCAEPPRERRVVRIAEASCDRFDSCDQIGPGETHETFGECVSDMEDTFYNLWPEDSCGGGQINPDEYRRCLDRAKNFPCDANFFDFASYWSSCNADEVCIDPRD